MSGESPLWRRRLSRELTERARAPAHEVLAASISYGGSARRIGVTGPPGAGKSSLIALLARQWTEQARKVGLIAVDPTSPLSGGALLGDRIRIDEIAANPNLFIRSLPSGSASDGLCPNILSLFDTFERAGFDHIILETVGVGQVSYQAKPLVDTFILVLVPESGDTIQAMKAGILELADIYVVNKADLPASAKLASELRAIALWRGQKQTWVPPVILTSATENRGAPELGEAIEAHRKTVLSEERMAELTTARREYHLRTLLVRQIDEVLACHRAELQNASLAESFRTLIAALGNSFNSQNGN
jgi:GTPase